MISNRAKHLILKIPPCFPLINDTDRERLVFHSVQYRNDWLTTSNLFHMFTQSIKFYTFHYQYRCLKNVIHHIDSKNGWCSFQQVYGKIWVIFCLNTGKRFFLEVSFSSQQKAQVLLKNGTRYFQNSSPFERSACFYATSNENFEHFQYFNFETQRLN